MRSARRLLLVVLLSILMVPLQGRPAVASATSLETSSAARALLISTNPAQINVGRDVVLTVSVRALGGAPGAVHISISGAGTTVSGTAAHGTLTVTVHATVLGSATVQASAAGFPQATFRVPIVPGPPASVVAIVRGLTIQPPGATVRKGAVGSTLFENYHAVTARAQLASLGMRDGTLVDLNSNTDALIKDPLHTTITGGEVFLAVVHGAVSHQVQAGSVVAATKGTRFDVRYGPAGRLRRGSYIVVVTVIQGRVLVTNGKYFTFVGAGRQTTVVGGLPPSPPKTVDVRAVVKWVLALPNTTASLVSPILSTAPVTATAVVSPTAPLTATAVVSPTAPLTGTAVVSYSPTATPTAVPASVAQLALTPPNAAVLPGSTVTLTGSGFQPLEDVTIQLDGSPLATETVGADGTFTCTPTLPYTLAAGTHTVTAVGTTSGLQASTSIAIA